MKIGKTDVKRSTSTPVSDVGLLRPTLLKSGRLHRLTVAVCSQTVSCWQKWQEKFELVKLPSREVVRAAKRAAWLLQLRLTPDRVKVRC